MKIYRQLKAKHNTFIVYRAKVWHGVNSLVNVLNMPNDHKFSMGPLSYMKQIPFESTGIRLQHMQKLSENTGQDLRYTLWYADQKLRLSMHVPGKQ